MLRLTGLPIRRIAVFRALKLGDFLVATPAFRALRAAFPEARIDYVGLPWAADIVGRYASYISQFIPFPGYPGLAEQEWSASAVTEFLQEMQRQDYDVVFQLHGRGQFTNPCVALWGARYLAGFSGPDDFWPNKELFMAYPDGQPEIIQLLKLLEHCGIRPQGTNLEFPLLPEDEQAFEVLAAQKQLNQDYACIHPGAVSSRPWPARYFAEVANACAANGLKVVVTGTAEERGLAERLRERMEHPALNLAGKTSLGTLAALIKHARLFIGNDTGTSHIAVAVGTPSVTIFSTSEPARWAPLDTERHPIVLPGQDTPEAVTKHALALLKKEENNARQTP